MDTWYASQKVMEAIDKLGKIYYCTYNVFYQLKHSAYLWIALRGFSSMNEMLAKDLQSNHTQLDLQILPKKMWWLNRITGNNTQRRAQRMEIQLISITRSLIQPQILQNFRLCYYCKAHWLIKQITPILRLKSQAMALSLWLPITKELGLGRMDRLERGYCVSNSKSTMFWFRWA